MTDKYQDIIDRLTKAEGPDRELDCWVGYHADFKLEDQPGSSWRSRIDKLGIDSAVESASRHQNIWGRELPYYTASLDASIALCARVLPGWAKGFDSGPVTHIAFVDPHDFNDRLLGARYTAEAKTPALALLLAIFKALQAQENADG